MSSSPQGTPARPLRAVVSLVAALVACVATGATAGAAPSEPQVSVYLLRGEQLARVDRPGVTPAAAVRELIAGATPAEVRRGYRSYVPGGTRLHRLTIADGLATVDLSDRFVSGPPPARLARLSQLVRTLTGPAGVTRVQLLIDGERTGGFPGVPTKEPITFRYLRTPDEPVPEPLALKLAPPTPQVKQAQLRLIVLGYLLRGDDDGVFGPATQNALIAFQKWERLARTGSLDARTKLRLATASRPIPRSLGPTGKRAEILLDRQVALLISSNRVIRTIAVSTGKPSTPTPPGNYRVYAKIARWWSTPFREWLPWALPFVGGIAFHEFPIVPTFPASHGCVRQSFTVARWTYDFAGVGMDVKVLAKS